MKTRNSIYTTSMENSFTSDSDESILDKEYDIDNYDTQDLLQIFTNSRFT